MGWMKRQLEESYGSRKGWSDYGGEPSPTRPIVFVQVYFDERRKKYILEGSHEGKRFESSAYARLATAQRHAIQVLQAMDDSHAKA